MEPELVPDSLSSPSTELSQMMSSFNPLEFEEFNAEIDMLLQEIGEEDIGKRMKSEIKDRIQNTAQKIAIQVAQKIQEAEAAASSSQAALAATAAANLSPATAAIMKANLKKQQEKEQKKAEELVEQDDKELNDLIESGVPTVDRVVAVMLQKKLNHFKKKFEDAQQTINYISSLK